MLRPLSPAGCRQAEGLVVRLALVAAAAAAAAVLVAPLVAGFRQSVALVLVGLVGLALTAAGVWWALTHKVLVGGGDQAMPSGSISPIWPIP